MRKHYVTTKSVKVHFGAQPVGIYVEHRGYAIMLADSLGKKWRIVADNAMFAKLTMEVIDSLAPSCDGALDLATGVQAWIDWMVEKGIVPESQKRIRARRRAAQGLPHFSRHDSRNLPRAK